MRIGLFVTCLTDTLFPDTGKAVVTVLERLGHHVDFPAGQTCCGQMHFNTGYRREAVPIVANQIAQQNVDHVIINRNGAMKSRHKVIVAAIPLNGQHFQRLPPCTVSTKGAGAF